MIYDHIAHCKVRDFFVRGCDLVVVDLVFRNSLQLSKPFPSCYSGPCYS